MTPKSLLILIISLNVLDLSPPFEVFCGGELSSGITYSDFKIPINGVFGLSLFYRLGLSILFVGLGAVKF